jgi:nitroreductase
MMSVRKSLLLILALVTGACSTEPKAPGILWLSYSTKIGDEQPFNWTLTFDDRAPLTISSKTAATAKFDSLSAGAHRMIVSDLPTQCTTGNDNRSIDVGGGDTVRLSIQVTCTRVTGDAAITVATKGPDRDLDGYTLLVDGQPLMALPPLASVTRIIPKLKPGTHLFTLSGVAPNCTVANGAASAFITAGKSILTSLSVDCVAVTGNLRVTTTTSGGAMVDPSGYVVRLNGSAIGAVAANAVTLLGAPAGGYTVSLADLEPNCTADVAAKPVTIAVGVTTDVAFDVTCGAYPPTTESLVATDATLDTLPNQESAATKSFDLIGLTTRYAASYMAITLRFNRPVAGELVYGYVDLDLDEETTTGITPFMNVFGGTASQGVDAFLNFATGSAPIGVVSTLAGGAGLVRTTADADSVTFIVPFERIDNDDGNLTITAIVGTTDRPTDWIPNSGVLVSHRPASANFGAVKTSDAIRERRTIKRFTDRAITRAEIEELLGAATLAPNHRLTNPWRFHVLGPNAREAYGRALGERKAKKQPDPAKAAELRDTVAAEHRALPAMIAVAVIDSTDAEQREEDYASAMMGVQNIMLRALEMGLGTSIKTGGIMSDPAARAAVGLPDNQRIVAIVNVGEPLEVPSPKPRTSALELTTWVP